MKMRWYELAENPHIITELYHEVPSLQSIDLMNVILSTDDAKLILEADLSRFAEKPLIQWVKQHYNTVQIRLEFRKLKSLNITQWSTENVVDAEIERTLDGSIALNMISSQCHIQAVAHSLQITSVSAYLQGVF
jgi:hypothetical protein